MNSSYTSLTTKPLYKGIQIVWYAVGIIEILLMFRFILKLLGANGDAGFVSFIYSVTSFLVAPFVNIFDQVQIQGMLFEWASLFAVIVYWILAWAIVNLFLMSKTVSIPEAAKELETQEEK